MYCAAAKLIDGIGAVSVIGAGINASYVNLLRGAAALKEAGIAPRAVSTSSFRITWIVPGDEIDHAVRALHRALVHVEPLPVP